jgi:hypothetical protein
VQVDLWSDDRRPAPWPLWIAPEATAPVPVVLRPGDAVFYRGRELTHFREPLPAGRSTSVFLHYVPRAFAAPLD